MLEKLQKCGFFKTFPQLNIKRVLKLGILHKAELPQGSNPKNVRGLPF